MSSVNGGQSATTTNSEEIVQQLTRNSREWVELDDKEKEAKEVIKAISSRKKELNESILVALDSIQKSEVKLGVRGGKLKYSATTSFAPLKKEDIFNGIKEEIDDEAKARTIVDRLYDKQNRDSKKVVTIKRTTR